MTYVVCQTPKCQQTYPIDDFKEKGFVNVACDKCGGVVIDEKGYGNMSQHPDVRPVITAEEIEKNRKQELKQKKEELAVLQSEIAELEQNV